ncbi:MAG TPA: hypothetical protein VF055_14680 [Steroidobacteraceae bacterium]
MSASGKTTRSSSKTRVRKPPPRWRRYLVQAELELPPPSPHEARPGGGDGGDTFDELQPLPWWQTRPAVFGLLALCLLLTVTTGVTLWNARGDREAAAAAEARARTLTLRAINGERALRITPNPRSWSAGADATLAWPEPPQLLELRFPVRQVQYAAFALVVDKVDHGRVMVVERMAPDSNRDLRLALNSSAFGPGEYRIRVQGYTWRGQRVDVGWVRLVVLPPR